MVVRGRDGRGPWKRWTWSVEKMDVVRERDGCGPWKIWTWSVEEIDLVRRRDGFGLCAKDCGEFVGRHTAVVSR